jgi:hypothetical protein
MLLNLSNHPSAKWPDAQRMAALNQYGEIRDLAFPQIPPGANTDEVRQIAEKYEIKIRQLAIDHPRLTVHVMGELTFTHMLVNHLSEIGIPCVASTTERIVTEESNGKKISHFNFIQFRSYDAP